jgi:acetoin:2,6-dichlorophenolindophenol oxidoreductase subunit beta
MPATPSDARDLLIAAVQSPDPVLYIDDRWLYEWEDDVGPPCDLDLSTLGPQILRSGSDITIGAASHSVKLSLDCAELLQAEGISCEVVDARILNPFDPELFRQSARKTGRFLAVDGGWSNCGFAAELIASVVEAVSPSALRCAPARITLPSAPAPTSKPLEAIYYPTVDMVANEVRRMVKA